MQESKWDMKPQASTAQTLVPKIQHGSYVNHGSAGFVSKPQEKKGTFGFTLQCMPKTTGSV